MIKIFFPLVIAVFWIFWLPGPRVATDLYLTSKSVQLSNIYPYAWREVAVADGLGEYNVPVLWSQPIHAVFGILSILVPFEVQVKLLGLVILLIGFWGIWRLLDYLNINKWGKGIGSIFFLLNSYFLLLFDGGQLYLALSYSILPQVFLYFLKLQDKDSWRQRINLAFWILIISIFDLRVVYLVLIIFLLFTIFSFLTAPLKSLLRHIKNLAVSLFFIFLILLGIHSYWLLPSILSKPAQLPKAYERSIQVDFLSFSSLGHALNLQQPHWSRNIFGQVSELKAKFIFIPIIVFLAPILKRKDRIVGFFLLLSLVGIFLAKGSNPPLSSIYIWLFSYVPGFQLFRDPSKFYFLTALGYSVLIGFSIQQLSELKFRFSVLNKIMEIIPIIFFIYLIWLIRPIYLGQMSGLFSIPLFDKDYNQLSNIFKDDNRFSRIFWIPKISPLGFSNDVHPSVETLRLVQKRPFAQGTKGSYEISNFLREAPFTGELFDISSIGYVVYPPLDPRRDDMHPDNIKYYYTFSSQLSNLSWLSKVDNSPIPLWKVKEYQDKFFVTSNIWWVIGSDNIYNEATRSAALKLSKNSLIFAEESAGLGEKLEELPEAKIVLNSKHLIDLAASFLKPENLIFPAKLLEFEPDESGWWKRETSDLIRWKDFLQSKYGIDNLDFDLGGGWAVGEGSLKLKVKREKLELRRNRVVLARVLESSRSGSLRFHDGKNQLIGEVVTKVDGNTNVRWFEVGQLFQDGEELEITSSGEINVVNALAVLDKNEWIGYQNKAKKLQGRIVDFSEINSDSKDAYEISFQEINPTKYKVNISGLKRPSFLIFSQNYDSLWKMDNKTSYPVYSLLNGFKVEKDGQYIVEFEAQKYVYPGLLVSAIMLTILLLILIRLK